MRLPFREKLISGFVRSKVQPITSPLCMSLTPTVFHFPSAIAFAIDDDSTHFYGVYTAETIFIFIFTCPHVFPVESETKQVVSNPISSPSFSATRVRNITNSIGPADSQVWGCLSHLFQVLNLSLEIPLFEHGGTGNNPNLHFGHNAKLSSLVAMWDDHHVADHTATCRHDRPSWSVAKDLFLVEDCCRWTSDCFSLQPRCQGRVNTRRPESDKMINWCQLPIHHSSKYKSYHLRVSSNFFQ